MAIVIVVVRRMLGRTVRMTVPMTGGCLCTVGSVQQIGSQQIVPATTDQRLDQQGGGTNQVDGNPEHGGFLS
ncbi:MAG: hypothetical protein WEA31_01285 [Pirellulales bacterium]